MAKSRYVSAAQNVANGRKAALQCLDAMMAETKNVQKLRAAMQEAFDIAPLLFFKDFTMPLLPKESLIQLETTAKAPIRIELTTGDDK